jgi:tol-pal system protein YbgF
MYPNWKSHKIIIAVSCIILLSPCHGEDSNPTFGELSARIDDLENQIQGKSPRVDDRNPGAQLTHEDMARVEDRIRHMQQEIEDLKELARKNRLPVRDEDLEDPSPRKPVRRSSLPDGKSPFSSPFTNPLSSHEVDDEIESVLKNLEQGGSEEKEEQDQEADRRESRKINRDETRENATRKAERNAPELPSGNAQAQYNEAVKLYEKGAYPEAVKAFDYFIDTYPKDSLITQAQYGKANALMKQGKYKDAKSLYINVYKKNPKGIKAPDCLLRLGEALAIQGKKDDACTAWKKLTTDFPQMTSKTRTELASLKKKHGCL